MKTRLKNPRIISAIGFLILIALIWFVGQLFDLSAEDRLIWIFGVMALWVLTLLVGQLLTMRARRLLEKMLRRQADEAVMEANVSLRGEVKQLRDRLLAAIRAIKGSGLDIYDLPWYMIIGHSAAGKSTALLQSGLTFPSVGDQLDSDSIQGVGGTRNCDWFFSTEGVLLDTAGRYSTQAEDRKAWLEFLKLLKRYRSKAPVNGILVATSLPELVQYNSEAFSTYARQIRERIHEIESVFELRVPIYLVFTKLDLLGGFSQFFGDLDEAERARVWGATMSHELDLEADFDIRREVERQCELLYQGIRQIGEDKLSLMRGVGGKPALFAFPLEFHALKQGVGRLVELLFEDNPFHGKPLLRGFYFTSALQMGEPHIAAAVRVSRQFSLTRGGFGASQPSTSRGYFLLDLFREVLFPDQYLIQRQTRPRANFMRMANMLGGLAALGVCVGLLTLSWLENREWLTLASAERAQATELIASEKNLHDQLKGLTLLQKRVQELQDYRIDGVPWKMTMGLYQGKKLEEDLRGQYFDALRTVLLGPLQGRLETVLKQLSSPVSGTPGQAQTLSREEYEALNKKGYEALKTYLMLADRSRIDAEYLSEQIPLHWNVWLNAKRGNASMDDINAQAEQLLTFYLTQLQMQEPDVPLIGNEPVVIEDSRLVLRNANVREDDVVLVYNDLKIFCGRNLSSLTVQRILDGKDADLLAGSATVQGVFTQEGSKCMVKAMDDASRGEIKGDDWVLKAPTQSDPSKNSSVEKKRKEFETLYRAEYAKAWMSFLRGLTVSARPSDVVQAGRMLERLANKQNSPIRIVLARVAEETAWDNPHQAVEAVANTVTRAREMTRGTRLDRRNPTVERIAGNTRLETGYGELGRQFKDIAIVVSGNKNDKQSVPLEDYLGRLALLKGQLTPITTGDNTFDATRKLIQLTVDGKNESWFAETKLYIENELLSFVEEQAFKDILHPLLVSPLLVSYATLLPPVERALDEIWQNEVFEQWKPLASKYPFSSSQTEAAQSEIASFIGPGGVVDKYISTHLGGLVRKEGVRLIPRTWVEMGVRFNPQFLAGVSRLSSLGSALTGSAATAEASRFELRPASTPGLREIRIKIDGQTLVYRDGPRYWHAFNWPGNDAQPGASIEVVSYSDAETTVFEKSGRMGVMRMFGASVRTLDSNMSSGQMEWRFRGSDGAQSSVKLDFKMTGGLNPVQMIALGSTALPSRVTEQR